MSRSSAVNKSFSESFPAVEISQCDHHHGTRMVQRQNCSFADPQSCIEVPFTSKFQTDTVTQTGSSGELRKIPRELEGGMGEAAEGWGGGED